MSGGGIERYKEDSLLSQTIEELEKKAERYFRSARALNTVKAHRYDLEHFATWCKVEAGGSPLQTSPQTPGSVAFLVNRPYR